MRIEDILQEKMGKKEFGKLLDRMNSLTKPKKGKKRGN